MATTTSKTGYGTLFQVETATPGSFETIGEVTSISGVEVTRDTVDATHMESPDQFEEVIASIGRTSPVQVTCAFLPDNTPQVNALATAIAGTLKNFKIDLIGTTKNWTFAGYITAIGAEVPFDGKMTRTLTIKPTGKPTLT